MPQRIIGIQLDPPSYIGRNVDDLCAELRDLANINTMFCFYEENMVHHTGVTAAEGLVRSMKPTDRSVDGKPIMQRLAEAGQKLGMRLFLGGGERQWADCAKIDCRAEEIDCFGKGRNFSGVNHPDWRRQMVAEHVDIFRHSDYLAGLMYMHERSGPFMQIFKPESWKGHFNPGCFCEHCVAKGRGLGLDPERAQQGFVELVRLFRDRDEAQLRDGVMVALWRVLCAWPETLAWEKLKWDSLDEYRVEVSQAIRSVRRDVEIGYHLQHSGLNADLPWRAGEEPARARAFADWIKPSVYPGCSGVRYRGLLRASRKTWLGDLDEATAHRVLSAFFGRSASNGAEGLGEEPARQLAFSADWVEQEIRRCKAAAAPLPVLAGLGMGIPGGEEADDAAHLAECARACERAGADGMLYSRHFSEMDHQHLRAAAQAVAW